MNTATSYHTYPLWIPVLTGIFNLGLYAIGFRLTAALGYGWTMLYALGILFVEWQILNKSCRSCFYYGKRCGLGKGWLCSRLFSARSRPADSRIITIMDMLPDFAILLFPPIAAFYSLLLHFQWNVLILAVVFLLLSFLGTALLRGLLLCKYCKQRELGCPAALWFQEKNHSI